MNEDFKAKLHTKAIPYHKILPKSGPFSYCYIKSRDYINGVRGCYEIIDGVKKLFK